MMARSGRCSVPRVSAACMSGTGSATIPSSAKTSSMVIAWVSSEVTTSTRAPATSRRRSAEIDRKSTRLNSSHTEIYTLSLHDALPIYPVLRQNVLDGHRLGVVGGDDEHPRTGDEPSAQRRDRSEEHTSELQSHRDLHSFPTRRSSDLSRPPPKRPRWSSPGCRRR